MLKPIEQGCLAMCTDEDNLGTCVTVGEFLPKGSPIGASHHTTADGWKVDKELIVTVNGLQTKDCRFNIEKFLMRIDDYDSSNDVQTEEIEQEQTA